MTPPDAEALENILEARPLITFPPTNIPRRFYAPRYEGVVYRGQALLDTNMFLRAIWLIDGRPAEDAASRQASAVLAFLTEIGFSCDPTMALFEVGMRQPHEDTVTDLDAFRMADHVRSQAYLDIALGRADVIPAAEIDEARVRALAVHRPPRNADFAVEPETRRNAYLVGLVILSLFQRNDLAPVDRAERLVTWMADEFFFMPACINWALHDFSPNVNGDSRILKRTTTTNVGRTRWALRNAAHDMATAKSWLDEVKRDEVIAVFCTTDRALQRVAELLVAPAGEVPARTSAYLESLWGPALGPRLYAHIHAEMARVQGPDRGQRAAARRGAAPALIAALEAQLGI